MDADRISLYSFTVAQCRASHQDVDVNASFRPHDAKRDCDGCAEAMTFVAHLPQIGIKTRLAVFRCYGCNVIGTDPPQRTA
jgi:hypothetical protein